MNNETSMIGYERVYDYTQYSHDNNVNVIPEDSFKKLIKDTFKTITDVLRETYGPYGSTVMITSGVETTTTKDGYNVFESIGFNHPYKHMVYLTIKNICERVNRNVGDGTTSCILLAEKMFDIMNDMIDTPDDKRKILEVMTDLEKDLQSTLQIEADKILDIIEPLTKESLFNMIMLSSNYDKELSKVIVDALSPEYNENGVVSNVRNVIADAETSYETESNAVYEIDYLPGDYRVRINMGTEFALSLSTPTSIKVLIYDHAFNETDWINFIKDYDNETKILIIARTFTRGFMDNEYVQYAKKCALKKMPVPIYLAEIKGNFVQNEIKDLAALLNTEVRGLHTLNVDHDSIPSAVVQVYKGNCLCFHNVVSPTDYIHTLVEEYKNDTSRSYIKQKDYLLRIKALSLISKDTRIVVKCGTSLECKMIMDKIDDCISIINSAIQSGIVPNLLVYAYYRMNLYAYENSPESFENKTARAIQRSISDMFVDIYSSKFGKTLSDSEMIRVSDKYGELYSLGDKKYEEMCKSKRSYDLIKDEFVNTVDLPTSAQYDLEVLIASISIVKYLLTSRAFIFDARIMPKQGDQGHYELK